MKEFNILCTKISIICIFIGTILIIIGLGYNTMFDGITEVTAGGFIFLSGSLGLLLQVYILNTNKRG